jgi:wyosine [tRNA(Phe)-imidazoG37] synthetase (radical SAM superfamily)
MGRPIIKGVENWLISQFMTPQYSSLPSVYGPVTSWRFGSSLGIDPIGSISTCSFNCAYCQLGEIEQKTAQRRVFVPSEQISRDLTDFYPWQVDIVTLSGSGEPTLALNLGEILATVKEMTGLPVAVLTNSTLLDDGEVRQSLRKADIVAAKLDAVSESQLRRINRPVTGVDWGKIWSGLRQFRQEWSGKLAIQTMLLASWSPQDQDHYIHLMQQLQPDEIQLNTPTRPRPQQRQLETRGNNSLVLAERMQILKPVSGEILATWAKKIAAATAIPVRCVPLVNS